MTERKPNGGLRPGSGRKPKGAAPMVRATYRMSKEQKDVVAENGGAELIRRMIERWRWEEGK